MIYEIVGLRIKINNKFSYTDKFCKQYLSPDQTSDCWIEVSVEQDEIDREKEKMPTSSDGYVENMLIYKKICQHLPKANRIFLHSAVVEYKGNCYAFLGESGVGKSTHVRLWVDYLDNSKILNGDKPVVGFENGEFFVYGTPWMGKERLGYKGKVKLKACCFLEQSKINEITKVSAKDVASRLFKSIFMPTEEKGVESTLEILNKMINEIPFYLLKCNVSNQAFLLSFNNLVGYE